MRSVLPVKDRNYAVKQLLETYLRETARLGELRREKVRRGTVKIPIDPGTVRIPT